MPIVAATVALLAQDVFVHRTKLSNTYFHRPAVDHVRPAVGRPAVDPGSTLGRPWSTLGQEIVFCYGASSLYDEEVHLTHAMRKVETY